MKLTDAEKKRFFDKVRVMPNGCHEWTGARDSRGYGRFSLNGRGYPDSRAYVAHRIAYIIQYGVELTSEQLVCHTCDNPSCVNPDHLFVGTHHDNMQDSLKKGRHSVLNAETVKKVYRRREEGASYYELAKEFGTSTPNVGHLITGRNWKHLHKEWMEQKEREEEIEQVRTTQKL
ncbi:MAG: hypothetical protein DDT19_00694 [Syntrophomonadaceae bacterium]|nr:hypothetical protein [Bacillota bacterium]